MIMKREDNAGEKARERFIKLFDKILKEEGDSFSEYMGIESFILDYEKGVYLVTGNNMDILLLEYMSKDGKFKVNRGKKYL